MKEIRVGNFKVVMQSVDGVDVIEVSNLASTWLVRIPSDFQMYGMLNRLLGEYAEDKPSRRNAEEWLRTFFLNFQNVTGIPSGHYHQGIMLLSGAYARPELLKSSFSGVGKKFYAEVKSLRLSFLRWAKEREDVMSRAEDSFDAESESLADEAKQLLEDGHGKE